MKSLNADQALWHTKKNAGMPSSLNEIEPACCWFWGCCWYWGMSDGSDDPQPRAC